MVQYCDKAISCAVVRRNRVRLISCSAGFSKSLSLNACSIHRLTTCDSVIFHSSNPFSQLEKCGSTAYNNERGTLPDPFSAPCLLSSTEVVPMAPWFPSSLRGLATRPVRRPPFPRTSWGGRRGLITHHPPRSLPSPPTLPSPYSLPSQGKIVGPVTQLPERVRR
jgi:hypothetical protein